jgi:rare lipoprotein A
MKVARSTLSGRAVVVSVLAVSAFALTACSQSGPNTASSKPTRSKEYFAESAYGVKASPRVTNQRSNLPRGGGRDQLGKPYKVRGKWYHPKESQNYRNAGLASWYGDAFHGRLTANGEIYDMTHLTAAHPTMPLPSYARVTNRDTGTSVIVRVNDRGPFAEGRIIDLSRRAAELLDYTHTGLASVDVEYVGRAPLHGQDDAYLMASYRPGNAAPDPSDGMPTGVMIAMNGPTPTTRASMPAFPGQALAAVAAPSLSTGATDVVLPDFGPIAPERPGVGLANRLSAPGRSTAVMSYADERVQRAAEALDAFATPQPNNDDLIQALNRRYARAPLAAAVEEHVAVGTYASQQLAEAMARPLGQAGRVQIETDYNTDGYSLRLYPDGRMSVDTMLRTAWAAGATDAMTVRE